jgi:uncharacterized lipoprotein YajG
MKRLLSMLVLACSVLVFTGCSGDSKPANTKPAATGGAGGGTTQPAEKK